MCSPATHPWKAPSAPDWSEPLSSFFLASFWHSRPTLSAVARHCFAVTGAQERYLWLAHTSVRTEDGKDDRNSLFVFDAAAHPDSMTMTKRPMDNFISALPPSSCSPYDRTPLFHDRYHDPIARLRAVVVRHGELELELERTARLGVGRGEYGLGAVGARKRHRRARQLAPLVLHDLVRPPPTSAARSWPLRSFAPAPGGRAPVSTACVEPTHAAHARATASTANRLKSTCPA